MFIAEINRDEDLYRVLSSDNKTLCKGSKKKCEDFMTNTCDNCSFYFEDSNYENVWQMCKNPNSEYYYQAIDNVDDRTCSCHTVFRKACAVEADDINLDVFNKNASKIIIPIDESKADNITKMNLNDVYFVQEDFCISNTDTIMYKHWLSKNLVQNPKGVVKINDIKWTKASEMKYGESRYRFTIEKIEIKNLDEIDLLECREVTVYSDYCVLYNHFEKLSKYTQRRERNPKLIIASIKWEN